MSNILKAIEFIEPYCVSSGFSAEEKSYFKLSKSALQKQEAMKIKEVHLDEYFCPACGNENSCSDGKVGDNFCPNCGQRIKQ